MTDDERYELDKKRRIEISERRESEIDDWISDIEKIFSQWLNMILKKKYPFVKGIADIRTVGRHYPDKEESIRIYLWTSPHHSIEDLKRLDYDLNSFLKMTSLKHRTLLDDEKWTMRINFYNVDDPSL